MPTVMIAEDDLMMADMLEEVLLQGGYDVCGIAHTVDKAVELGEQQKPDLAILDIRLAGGGIGTDIPARLKYLGRMGVLYASGHADQVNLTKADGDALLVKPYRSEDVLRALRIVELIVRTDENSQRFPVGFSLLPNSSKTEPELIPTGDELDEKDGRPRRHWAVLDGIDRFVPDERDFGSVLIEAVQRRVAVVDDDEFVRESVRFLLEVMGHPVEIFGSAAEFLNDEWHHFACLVLYHHMPHVNGLELAERLRAEGARVPILLITGSPSPAIVARASKLGIEKVLETSPGHQDLLDFIDTTKS